MIRSQNLQAEPIIIIIIAAFGFIFRLIRFGPIYSISVPPEACNFIKKETRAEVFSSEFCEISKNTFFTEHLCMTASNVIYF